MFATVEADFGLFMLREAPANEPLVVSPLSVIFALAMLQAGARVTTKNQINKVISKGESDDDIVAYYSNLSQQILKAKDGVDTKIANGFFLDNQYEIEDHYKDMVTKYYSAKVESYDFGKPDESAEIIDNFVSNVTEGKVRGMVKPNNVKGAFALIVNAIYFTAEWSVKFDQSSNSKRTFFSAENSEKELGFMNKVDYKLYAEDVDLQVLSLQYKDTSYAFNILLPKKRFGLGEVLKTIDGEKVQHLLSKLKETYVSVTIPKMKIESDYKLKEALIMMGVTDMFNDSADLTGIAKSPPLRVSKALHRAIIEVDEDGTTAAAATVIGIEGGSFTSAKPVDFIADHPFIFILTNDRNPLFIGQFV
ncbi:serine proteinase inhibitor [Ancylostoma caninum]|uniref:Serine proteinase inhibitor n=1 Tax=Ancylostoma caninum TaxID=29170 RepID=A0A368GF96_ANCCA|nr:serine proteinase inhibitor [Ancylostoma caninum]